MVPNGLNIHPSRATVGEKIIISGPIAVHGIAIMSVREGLEFEAEIARTSAARESSIRFRANNSLGPVNSCQAAVDSFDKARAIYARIDSENCHKIVTCNPNQQAS